MEGRFRLDKKEWRAEGWRRGREEWRPEEWGGARTSGSGARTSGGGARTSELLGEKWRPLEGGGAGKSGGRMLLIFIICRWKSFTLRIDWRDSV